MLSTEKQKPIPLRMYISASVTHVERKIKTRKTTLQNTKPSRNHHETATKPSRLLRDGEAASKNGRLQHPPSPENNARTTRRPLTPPWVRTYVRRYIRAAKDLLYHSPPSAALLPPQAFQLLLEAGGFVLRVSPVAFGAAQNLRHPVLRVPNLFLFIFSATRNHPCNINSRHVCCWLGETKMQTPVTS